MTHYFKEFLTEWIFEVNPSFTEYIIPSLLEH